MKRGKLFLLVSVLIILFFSVFAISQKNYEFLAYSVVGALIVWLIYATDKIYKYSNFSKISFLVWIFLHFAGGLFKYNGKTWYSTMIITLVGEPFNILKYDQVLHFAVYFIATFFLYSVVMSFAEKNTSKFKLWLIIVLSAVGVGALNEIMEFGVYIYYANSGVGTYINNALDLVFNTLGAMLGARVCLRKYKIKK